MSLNRPLLNKETKKAKAGKPKNRDKQVWANTSMHSERSRMGYRDDSPYKFESSIDINAPDGLIDMSATGIPIVANGRVLPPYSGMHQFEPGMVHEEPMHQMPDGSWMPGATHEEYQIGGTVSQVWEQATGTPWSQAKAQGLTSGSYNDNVALMQRLNAGEFTQAPTPRLDARPTNYDPSVAKKQRELIEAGYYIGDYGRGKNGVDGVMGELTVNAWESYKAGAVPEEVNVQQTDIKNKKETEKLQTMLVNKGYNIGKFGIDGEMGMDTTKAMAAYDKGIPPQKFNSQLSADEQVIFEDVQQEAQVREVQQNQAELDNNVITAPTVQARKEERKKEEKKVKEAPDQGHWVDDETYQKPELSYTALTADEAPTPKDYENALGIYDDLFMSYNQDTNKFEEPKGLEGRLDIITDLSRDEEGVLQCASSALNCESEFVSSRLGLDSSRESIQASGNIRNTPYSLPSKNPHKEGADYKHNASYDSWEIGDALLHSKRGFEVYNRDKALAQEHDEYSDPNATKGINYGKVALGSLVLWGGADEAMGDASLPEWENEGQPYTPKGLKNKPRHTTTVIGFDKDDGHPLIYDYGKVRRLEDAVSVDKHGVLKHIITPNQFKGYDYENLNYLKNVRDKELGVTSFEEESVDKGYTDSNDTTGAVNAVYRATDELIPEMARRYGVHTNLLKKMQERVVGIGMQESNLANMGAREEWEPYKLGFNEGDAVKPWRSYDIEHSTDLEHIGNKQLLKEFLADDETVEGSKADWQLEVQAQKMVEAGDTRNLTEIYKELKDKTPEAGSKVTSPSIGPYKIKNFPKYLTDQYGMKKNDLIAIGDKKEQLAMGSQAALALMVENFQMLKKKSKEEGLGYTDDEMLDMATIGYNSSSKMRDNTGDFYKYYIGEGKVLKDNYLEKVKAYSNTAQKVGTYNKTLARKQLEENPIAAPTLDTVQVAESTGGNNIQPINIQPNMNPANSNNAIEALLSGNTQPLPDALGWNIAPTLFDEEVSMNPNAQFKDGGTYTLEDSQIEELKRLGYRIEEMD